MREKGRVRFVSKKTIKWFHARHLDWHGEKNKLIARQPPNAEHQKIHNSEYSEQKQRSTIKKNTIDWISFLNLKTYFFL